jgi:hypothetical protein
MGGAMSIVLAGSTSGTITLQEPAVAGTNTLSLPAATGTIALTGAAVTTSQLPAGTILQVRTNTVDGVISTTTQGDPSDITKGAQVFSLSFTPLFASSVLLVQTSSIVISEETNFGDIQWLALWNGATFVAANSGGALFTHYVSNLNVNHLSLNNSFSAGSTSARTISVRAGMGGSAGTTYINGNSTSNYSGSSARIQMTVWEIAA